jgi:hypothetical protein
MEAQQSGATGGIDYLAPIVADAGGIRGVLNAYG